MAKGQQRSAKEKKKPKAEWNKGGSAQTAYAAQYGVGPSKPEQSPFSKKG
jgi:hypothetical protein